MKTLYVIHVSCALLSIGGFALRYVWMLRGDPRRRSRLARILPHVVDTVLLASAVGLLVQWRLSPLAAPWLVAKLAALLLYIALGMVALRFGRRPGTRAVAGALALLTALYIVAVALTKSPWGPLAPTI